MFFLQIGLRRIRIYTLAVVNIEHQRVLIGPGQKKTRTEKPNRNRTKLFRIETESKPSNIRMVPIFLYPNNRTETGTEPRTERVPEYPKK